MKKIVLLFLISLSVSSFGQGFLHRNGQNIVDGNNQNVVLRGLGLGGWMVQEGYMLQTGSFAGSQHAIKQKVTDLIGIKNTEKFYDAYKANGITKRDIDSLAAWGFNSVRLPMHYNLYTLPIEKEAVSGQNTWLEEGFKMTDDLLKWCAANKIYLICMQLQEVREKMQISPIMMIQSHHFGKARRIRIKWWHFGKN